MFEAAGGSPGRSPRRRHLAERAMSDGQDPVAPESSVPTDRGGALYRFFTSLWEFFKSFLLGSAHPGADGGAPVRPLRWLMLAVWATFLALIAGRQMTLLVPLDWASSVVEGVVKVVLTVLVLLLLLATVAREGGLREGGYRNLYTIVAALLAVVLLLFI